jgi:hypothetical protein
MKNTVSLGSLLEKAQNCAKTSLTSEQTNSVGDASKRSLVVLFTGAGAAPRFMAMQSP